MSKPSDFAARSKIIKALAHPTRLFIVDALSRGELCVRELTKRVGADISTVSKHLSILKGMGILQDRKQGLRVFYSLRCPCVMGFFKCVEGVVRRNAGVLGARS
jgi:DNA-binding transcriptional ArsR family regulator